MSEDNAKRARPRKPRAPSGPYVLAAFICEQLIQDKEDDVFSVIRIVDQVTVTGILPPGLSIADLPKDQIVGEVALRLGIFLRNLPEDSDTRVRIRSWGPKGREIHTLADYPLQGSGPFGAANIQIRAVLGFRIEGVYWFEVALNGQPMAFMPLGIQFALTQAESEPESATNRSDADSVPQA